MASSNNNEIVKMLLQNLTESLTQIVSKYEVISKDCDRIEEKTESIHGQMHDIKEIKDIAAGIRVQCENNQQSINSIINVVTEVRDDLDELLNKASESHAQHSAKLGEVLKKVTDIGSDTSEGLASIEAKVDDVKTKIAPIVRVSKIVSTPLGVIIVLLGIMMAIFLLEDTVQRVTDKFKTKTTDNTSVTNRVDGHNH